MINLNVCVAKKLQSHAEDQIKRKEPGILQLAKKYNQLCGELKVMLERNEGPRGAVAPLPIEKDGLFNLDVDDDIWQDIGLEDRDPSEDIPLWLGDDDVRRGIKVLLELDRCNEEQRRLCKEREAMQEWMMEEWNCLMIAKEHTDNIDMLYQVQLTAEYLTQLCVIWQTKVRIVPTEELPSSWGPTLEELAEARNFLFTANTVSTENIAEESENDIEEDDEDEKDVSDEDEETELLEAMERMALANEYRQDEYIEEQYGESSQTGSPERAGGQFYSA